MMNPTGLPKVVRILRPLFLLEGVLLYTLGAGIARYLGNPVDWQVYGLGQACVTLLQLLMVFLKEFFDSLSRSQEARRSPVEEGGEGVDAGRLTLQQSLLAVTAALTVCSVLTFLLLRDHYLNVEAATALGIAFLLAFFYAAPPLRWVYGGYGELVTAVLVCNLIPALAFLLQAGDLHRLLAMATFPLTPLYVALGLAQSLPGYASDLKAGHQTLMLRMGWKQGMGLHNTLVLAGFLLLAAAISLGMPWSIGWPALLVLPIGGYQVWQMVQISDGVKPRWSLLTVTAMATFGLAAYFLAIGFWAG
jgi:1,4-dihydroxy-2-naphthoate octaprenyltransferase